MSQLQKYEGGGAVGRPMDIEALCRAAVEKGKEGVEVLERLMVIRRELNAEQAKAAYDAALAAFQDECPPIPKGKTVRNDSGATLYNYAPFENVLAVVRPVMKKHGLSFTLDTDTDSKDGWVIATCRITHTAGHSETSRAKFPLGSGTRAMSTTQVFAAALSFASRRVFCNALGIVTVGEDFDGSGGRPKQRAPGQKPPQDKPTTVDPRQDAEKRLWTLLEPVRGSKSNWAEANAWMVRHSIIPAGKRIADLSDDDLAAAYDKTSIQLDQDNGKL